MVSSVVTVDAESRGKRRSLTKEVAWVEFDVSVRKLIHNIVVEGIVVFEENDVSGRMLLEDRECWSCEFALRAHPAEGCWDKLAVWYTRFGSCGVVSGRSCIPSDWGMAESIWLSKIGVGVVGWGEESNFFGTMPNAGHEGVDVVTCRLGKGKILAAVDKR